MSAIRCLATFGVAILIGAAGSVCQASATTQPAATQPAASEPHLSQEQLDQKMIRLAEQTVVALQGINDVESAKATAPAIRAYRIQIQDIVARFKKAGLQMPELQSLLQSKYPERMKKIDSTTNAELNRLYADPAVWKIVNEAWLASDSASPATQKSATQPAASQPTESLEAVGEGYMQLLQDVIVTFKTVTDEASAKAAIPAIDRFGTRNHDLRARMQKAGIPIEELQKFMESKHPEQLKALQAPFVVEMERISNSHDKAMKKIIREACARNGIGVASEAREQE